MLGGDRRPEREVPRGVGRRTGRRGDGLDPRGDLPDALARLLEGAAGGPRAPSPHPPRRGRPAGPRPKRRGPRPPAGGGRPRPPPRRGARPPARGPPPPPPPPPA